MCGCTFGQAVTRCFLEEAGSAALICCVQSPGADWLGDPLGGYGGFGAPVATAAAGVGVGPGAPVFLLEELDEDALCVGRAGGGAERGDDGVLLRLVEDAVDEDSEIGAQEREVDAEFAECGGLAGLRDGCWDLMASDGGGFERFALIGIFAGAGDRVDEGVAVGDDQAADDPCRDFVSAQFASFISRTAIPMDARPSGSVSRSRLAIADFSYDCDFAILRFAS
jgi:hypothetical protein